MVKMSYDPEDQWYPDEEEYEPELCCSYCFGPGECLECGNCMEHCECSEDYENGF